MGITAVELPKIIEILGPGGQFDVERLALRQKYDQVVLAAKKITAVENVEQATEATGYGRLLQAATKDSEDFYKAIKQQIDAIKKPVLALEKSDTQPYEAEKLRLGSLVSQFNQQEARKHAEAERKAREESERQAREEQLNRAIELEALGESEASEAVLEEVAIAAPVILPRMAAKPTGSVLKVTYGCEVVNLMELIKAVAAGTAPIQCLQPDESFLRNQAVRFKEGFAIPGCRLTKSEAMHFRT